MVVMFVYGHRLGNVAPALSVNRNIVVTLGLHPKSRHGQFVNDLSETVTGLDAFRVGGWLFRVLRQFRSRFAYILRYGTSSLHSISGLFPLLGDTADK